MIECGLQRDASASMSACMRSLYSSDQCAPGFDLLLWWGRSTGSGFRSGRALRAPAFSLRVTRVVVGLDDEFESLMQVYLTPR